ncbi:MAG TPA: IS21 family transposase [Anaerolineales bacterium]|jgi:transposase
MITVDEYEAIRRAYYVGQKSMRQIAREQGHGRKTVRKALAHAGPGRYTPKQARTAPVLGPYKARIEALLLESEQMPRKQRYTGHKICQILQKEGYVGSEPSVRRYIGQWRRLHKAPVVYLPLAWEPGADAQADWGEGEVVMGGVPVTVALFSIRLCYSRRLFVMAFPTQKVEAFLEAQVQAFGYFEGVPRRISYDNLKTAVKTILTGHEREEQVSFRAFRSHYLFESHFCNPGQGHEKGGVEHAVGYGRRNFLVPIPQVASFEELNAYLLAQCRADEGRTVHGQPASIRDAWQHEKGSLLPLPAQDYPCCTSQEVRLTPYGQVVFETNRYSVPANQARTTLTLRAYPFTVEILNQGQVIARHGRCYGHGQDVFDPLHYLPLLARRPGAFEYAKPLRAWRERWPPVYEEVLARLRSTWPDGRGVREFIQVLQLHGQYPASLIETALQQALGYGCVHYEGIRLCLNQLLLPQPETAPLNLEQVQLARLQPALAQPLDLHQYDQLIGGD